MALISDPIVSFVRLLKQAWHTIPMWEDPTGQAWNAQCDAAGALIVSVGGGSGAIEVQGTVDDDDPVGTTKPLVIGGVYYADPTADTLDDGDAGYALLNELRMLVVEDRAYDAASDANRVIPVWNPTDLWTPEDLSGSATADGTTSYYVELQENSRWSLQYIPTEAASEVITLEVYQSNENDPDITARTYTEVTDTFFGTGGFTAETWVEPEDPTRALSLRVDVTVSGYTAGTSEWDLWLVKGGNS